MKRKIKKGLIFEEEDIYKASNLLVKLVRKIFWENKLTYEDFYEKVRIHYQVKRKVSNLSLSIAVSNLLSPILGDHETLTWRGLNKLIEVIFDGIITDIEIQILSEDKDISNKYSVSL